MLILAKDRASSLREKAYDGEGVIQGLHSLAADNKLENTHFKMIGFMSLPKGSVLGFHVHHDDEEIYIITGGRGIFTDNDGRKYPVLPGDVTITKQGEGHALANDGDDALTFNAVIVTKRTN